MNSTSPPIFNMVRPCALIMTLLFAGATTGFAEVFTWSPQCPDPTWFGVCEGEICDIENNTPLSLNNWGRSTCGDVPFPGVAIGDDVIIPAGDVNWPTTPNFLNSITLAEGATLTRIAPFGAEIVQSYFHNFGTFQLNGQVGAVTGSFACPNFMNFNLVTTTGNSVLANMTNAGELFVQSGTLELRFNHVSEGGFYRVADGSQLILNAGLGGEFFGDVQGTAALGQPNFGVGFAAEGVAFLFTGNGLDLQGTIGPLQGGFFQNLDGGIMHRRFSPLNNQSARIFSMLRNDGYFFDEGSPTTPQIGHFENFGVYKLQRGLSNGVGWMQFDNFGVIQKTTSDDQLFSADFLHAGGLLDIPNGALAFNRSFTQTGGRITVGENASFVLSGDVAGVITVENQGDVLVEPLVFIPAEGVVFDIGGNPMRAREIRGESALPSPLTIAPRTTFEMSDRDAQVAIQPFRAINIDVFNHGRLIQFADSIINVGIEKIRLFNHGEFSILPGQGLEDCAIYAEIENFGRIHVLSPWGWRLFDTSITNHGWIQLDAGWIIFDDELSQDRGLIYLAPDTEVTRFGLDRFGFPIHLDGGAITGCGTVDHSIENFGGVIAPGCGVGALNVNGSIFTPSTTGIAGLAIELDSSPENDMVDQLIVGSTFGAGAAEPVTYGSLRVAAVDGFVPQIGSTYEIVSAGYVADGAFDRLILVDFPDGLTVETSRNETSLSITIVTGDGQQLLGDMNCDGAVNTDDITGFVTALTDRDAYAFEIPICDANRADMNSDGALNGADIPLFMQVLLD